MSKVAVIVPAAGAGKRFGGDVRKPFAQIDNRPVFIRTIELFVNRADVCQMILTVSPQDYEVVKEKYAANLMFMNIRLVQGGAERRDSVRAALAAVDDAAEFVCVHDAVRPCILEEWIDQVFEAAAQSGAAILATPLHGTLKRVRDGKIAETVSREGLFEAQTPQVFRKDLLRSAYEALPPDAAPTDDAQVVEMAGHVVTIVRGDARNIKITTPGDMVLAGAILKGMTRKAKPATGSPFNEAQW